METIVITVLGHTFRAPQDEAEALARKVAELEAQAAQVPGLLSQLDETSRRHERVERQLAAIRAAADAASTALTEEPASKAAA